MAPQLLTTKFYIPPVRDNLVPRPHLVNRLNGGLKGPLTLVSAPAGYGKTTLLAEWRSSVAKDLPIGWLSLDAEDNDLPRFLCYLIFAIDRVRTGLVSNTLPLLQASQFPSFESILTSLVNDLSCENSASGGIPQDLILILDDYYLITPQAIHEAVVFLLAHMPPILHLVILTREDPPLPIPKLRARGEINEIRESDLRFTLSETKAFLSNTAGLDLTEQGIITLLERTEGWIAGLQMAARAIASFPTGWKDRQRFISVRRNDDHKNEFQTRRF